MLQKWRQEIDLIDSEIINLLAKRMNIVKRIWKYKKEKWINILQEGRWNDVLKSRKKIATELGLKEEFIEDIWNRIHDYALNIEEL